MRQIVIDVPEKLICEGFERPFTEDEKNIIIKAIGNCIPLPKGHGDLIDVNRKITMSVYDEQYEEWGEKTMTVLEALNKWSDEGVTIKDVIVSADNKEGEEKDANSN